MEESDRQRISSSLDDLSAVTNWNEDLESGLVAKDVFNLKMLQKIKTKHFSPEDRNRQLYVDIQRRGPEAFRKLIKILVESKNYDAAKILDPNIVIVTQLSKPPLQSRESKVWNPATYEKATSLDAGPYPDPGDVPMVDDRIPVSVRVVNAARFRGPPQYNAYPIGSSPRGLALIIDNERFENNVLPFREGSQIDANNLDILFEQLGFKVTLRRNQSYEEIYREITTFARNLDHSKGDMCIVAILSHGDNGLVFARDGRSVPTEWILRQFNNSTAPQLKGKPKFFIFQACRGDETDYGYIPQLETGSGSSFTAVDAIGFKRGAVLTPVEKDPTWEDMLIAYATVPGYVANRNHYRGTWFIEAICRVFMRNASEYDLRELLDQVSQQLKNYESEFGTKQSCSYEVRHFYKKLYLNPGLTFPTTSQPTTAAAATTTGAASAAAAATTNGITSRTTNGLTAINGIASQSTATSKSVITSKSLEQMSEKFKDKMELA